MNYIMACFKLGALQKELNQAGKLQNVVDRAQAASFLSAL